MSAENEANKESSGLLSDIREPRDLRPSATISCVNSLKRSVSLS